MAGRRGDQRTLDQLIADGIAAALPIIVNHLRAEGGAGGAGPAAPRCSYQTFLNCKPSEFNGTEGASGIIQWIESIEAVFEISECPEDLQVKYATTTFQGRARTWWNAQIQTRGRDAVGLLSWEDLKVIVLAEYCSKSEMQRIESEFWELRMEGYNHEGYTSKFHELARLVPTMVTPESKRIERYVWGLTPEIRRIVMGSNPATMHDAASMAGTLAYDFVRESKGKGLESKEGSGGKRKMVEDQQDMGAKRQQMVANPTPIRAVRADDHERYQGDAPRCKDCGYHHRGNCMRCNKCNKIGHLEKSCRAGMQGGRACYECGSPDHLRRDCPRIRRDQQQPPRNVARGRVFRIGAAGDQVNQDADPGKLFGDNFSRSVVLVRTV